MPSDTNASFRTWLNSNNTINLSFNVAVICMTYEGITNFASLTNFDKKSIESIPTTCRENTLAIKNDPESDITAEPSITGANRSSIAICQFIVAVKADKYYTLIGRTMNTTNMHYSNVLSSFNI